MWIDWNIHELWFYSFTDIYERLKIHNFILFHTEKYLVHSTKIQVREPKKLFIIWLTKFMVNSTK